MKTIQKKLALLLCVILTISLVSSCGQSNGSKQENKNEIGQSETITGTNDEVTSEESESQEAENDEAESETSESETKVPESSEQSKAPENSEQTKAPESSEQIKAPESEDTSSQESQDKKPSSNQNTNQNTNQNNKPSNNPQNNDKNESSSQTPSTQTPSTQTPELSDGEKLAKKIVDEIIKPGMSDFEKAITIHDWLTFNIDYDFSYSNYDIESTLKTKKAVCQGYALSFETMAEMAGLEAAFIGGTADNGSGAGYQSHAWNRVKIDGTWYNVDTTWDDPANTGKDPSDHTANRYDYFLISDTQLNKDHKASEIPSDCGSCSKNYERLTILKYAANSGKHGNVALATNADEVNAAVKKYMDKECTMFWLWYYDSSVTVSNMWDTIHAQISKCAYPAQSTFAYPPENNLTKYQMSITPMSKWNEIPVVANGAEFETVFNAKKNSGVTEFTIRYESANGILDFGFTGGFSYCTTTYNNGKSYLLTVYIG